MDQNKSFRLMQHILMCLILIGKRNTEMLLLVVILTKHCPQFTATKVITIN